MTSKDKYALLEPGIYYCIETFNDGLRKGEAIIVVEKERQSKEKEYRWELKIFYKKLRTLKRVESPYFNNMFSYWFSKTPPKKE